MSLRFVNFYSIHILFVFGRNIVAAIQYSAEYFKSLFGTALVLTMVSKIEWLGV